MARTKYDPGTPAVTAADARTREVVDRLMREGLIGLGAAARHLGTFRGGRPCHPSTLSRWCLHGAASAGGATIVLEHVRLGNRLMTSRAALVRFLAALTAGGGGSVPPPRSPAETRSAAARADEELRREGL